MTLGWAACLLLLNADVSAAQSADPERGLHYDLVWDGAITAGAGVAWLSLELLTPTLVDTCRWCDRNADGSDALNGFDRSARDALRWDSTQRADTWSSVFSFALAPLAGLGVAAIVTDHDDRLSELPSDALLVAESAFVAMALNQVVKILAARERPDVHARSPEERKALHAAADNLSFFSGHTNLAFALATASGTIASMRGYRLAPVMWVSGMTLACISGYLRIAADRHYATDVLMGAAFGAAAGFVVPYFFHRPQQIGLTLTAAPRPGGAALTLGGTF